MGLSAYTCLLILLMGCTPIGKSGLSDPKIVGGEEIEAGSFLRLHTVGLVLVNADANQIRSICTGTILAQNFLITAAHCTKELVAPGMRAMVYFGMNTDEAQPLGAKLLPIVRKWNHPLYLDTASRNFDVAVYEYEGTVPDSYIPATLFEPDPNTKLDGHALVSAGYGKTSFACLGREATCSGKLYQLEGSFGQILNTPRIKSAFIFRNEKQKGLCNGDSGGPTYIHSNGTWKLIGTTSGTWRALTPEAYGDDLDVCQAGATVLSYLPDYIPWITQILSSKTDPAPATTFSKSFDKGSILDWCQEQTLMHPSWVSMQLLLEHIHGSFAETEDSKALDAIYFNCDVAAAYAAKYLATHDELIYSGIQLDLATLKGRNLQLRDLGPLQAWNGLRSIKLLYNAIPSLQALEKLPLEHLALFHNQTFLDGAMNDVSLDFANKSDSTLIATLKELHLENLALQGDVLDLSRATNLQTLTLRQVRSSNPAGLKLLLPPHDIQLNVEQTQMRE